MLQLPFCALEMGVLYTWLKILRKKKDFNGKTRVMLLMSLTVMGYSASQLEKKITAKKLESLELRYKLEKKKYKNMEKLHEEYDIYLHDMKHTLRAIAALAEEEKCREIELVIEKQRIAVGNIEQEILCSHPVLNALLLERKGYADDNGVTMKLEIKEPLYLQDINDLDLTALVGNLLDNAIEAELHSRERKGVLILMKMAREGRHMIIQVENSCTDRKFSEKLLIRKEGRIGEKHGIGLKSVRKNVNKYGGIIDAKKADGRYCVKIILPIPSGWEGAYPDSSQEVEMMN